METFFKDLKHSLRMFRQTPAFTVSALAALALGIGANVAIFTLVDAVLLKPAPFPEPDRLVLFMTTSSQGSAPGASPAKFAHWRRQTGVVGDITAFRLGVVNLTDGEFPEQLRSGQVSADFFRLFGAVASQGRTFAAEEDRPGGPRVALLSHGLWQRRFGGDPAVVGRTIALGGDPHEVVGVLDAAFTVAEFGPDPEVWTPFQLDPDSTDQGHYFTAAGRLNPGVGLEQAQARLAASAAEFRERFPDGALAPESSFSVEPIREVFVRNARTALRVLFAAVGLVLLIACANVANLLLARATGRQREMAIRAAVGAGRGRIVRQLLTESVLLSGAGGVAGFLLGVAGIRAILAVNTAGLPRVGEGGALVTVDWRVAAFTILVAVVTGVLFGLFPALQGSRVNLGENLRESGSRAGTGLRQNRVRALLVVSEVALALVLLVGAALLVRTFVALGAVDPGFNTQNVLTLRMSLTGERFQSAAGVDQMVQAGLERLAALPGVAAASATCCVPLQGGYGLPFTIVGRPAEGPFSGGGGWSTVSPGFFDVFEIPVLRGRDFAGRDGAGAPPVVIINEVLADQFWPGGDPLGERLIIGRGVMREFADEPEREIIGVVGAVRGGGLANDPGPLMYVPQAQLPDAVSALNLELSPLAWVVRVDGAPGPVSAAVQEQLRQVTGLPVANVMEMSEVLALATSRQQFNMLLMTIFAAAALLLAAIGVYGLMAYAVEQRTREIGIRLALGAESAGVRRMIVFQGLRLALAGVVLGLAAAFGLARFLSSLLFGVQAFDPLTFAAAPLLLTLVAFLAVWAPARRASRIDPLEALRHE